MEGGQKGGLMMETEVRIRFEDADTAGFEAGLKLQITGYLAATRKGRTDSPLELLEKAWF